VASAAAGCRRQRHLPPGASLQLVLNTACPGRWTMVTLEHKVFNEGVKCSIARQLLEEYKTM